MANAAPLGLEVDYLLEQGRDLPEYLLFVLERLPPTDLAVTLVAYHRLQEIAAAAGGPDPDPQGTIRRLSRDVDALPAGPRFTRGLGFLLAALVGLGDRYMRFGEAYMYYASDVWRHLLGAAPHILNPAVRGLWSDDELGVLASANDPVTLRNRLLGHVLPVIYRGFMSEFLDADVVAVEPENYVDIF
jgi:hypothetical protein